jgi:AcrR family transcriptional regulator
MPGDKASEEQRRRQILEAAFRVAVQKGLDGTTGRAVAAEAGLSSGLVFFYYPTKEALLVALLDDLVTWLFGDNESAPSSGAPQVGIRPRFVEALHEEIEIQGEDYDRIRLFLEYWVLGARHPVMRERLHATMTRSRALFQTLASEALDEHGQKWPELTPESLAALAVSLTVGCALQGLVDPDWLATARPLTAIDALFQKEE